jgi:phosphoribosylanthranilate isomerase
MESRVRIKLCGLGAADQVELARDLGVELIGLVFAEHSHRRLTVEAARKALAVLGERRASGLPLVHDGIPTGGWFERCATGLDSWLAERRPRVVGVFVNQPPALINAIVDLLALDLVQLSGNEPWSQALEMHRPVIKAIHVQPPMTAADLLGECEYGTAAMTLLDTAVAGSAGGTGVSFDWKVAAHVARQMPMILAGGLTPETVGDAISTAHPWAVDVSSGIESAGVKDFTKMRAFVEAARHASSEVERAG